MEYSQKWVFPDHTTPRDYRAIYSFGTFANPTQASRYTGKEGFIANTGQRIKSKFTNPFLCGKTIHTTYNGDYTHLKSKSLFNDILPLLNERSSL